MHCTQSPWFSYFSSETVPETSRYIPSGCCLSEPSFLCRRKQAAISFYERRDDSSAPERQPQQLKAQAVKNLDP